MLLCEHLEAWHYLHYLAWVLGGNLFHKINSSDNFWCCYSLMTYIVYVSEIGAVVKVTESHLCGWGKTPGKSCMSDHCTSCVLISMLTSGCLLT